MSETESTATISKLPLLIMGAVACLAVLLVLAIVAIRDAPTYEAGTPEAVLQTFLNTSFDGDADGMLALLTPESKQRCTREFDRFGDYWYEDSDLRATLDSSSAEGDTAKATVSFQRSSASDPFDSSSWSFDARYTLERIDGDWMISQAGWPDFIADCTRSR